MFNQLKFMYMTIAEKYKNLKNKTIEEMVDAFCDPFEITPDEIEFGNVSFITDRIPDRDLS